MDVFLPTLGLATACTVTRGHDGSAAARRRALVILMQIRESPTALTLTAERTEPHARRRHVRRFNPRRFLNNPSVGGRRVITHPSFSPGKKKNKIPAIHNNNNNSCHSSKIDEFVAEPPAKFPREHADQSSRVTLLRD